MSSPIARQIERLLRERSGAPVVSCYLKIEPRDRARGKYLIKLKNRLKVAEQSLERRDLTRTEREHARADLDRLRQFLAAPDRLPPAQGVAVFVSGARKLFEVVPLPSVHRSRLAVERAPLFRELAGIEDDIGSLWAVVVDRASARFFRITAFGAEPVGPAVTLAAPARPQAGVRRTSRRPGPPDHNRIRSVQQRHWEAVAQQLFLLDRATPARAIVLLGQGPTVVAVEPFLHPYLAERLIGHGNVHPRDATPSTVYTAALEVRRAWERARERAGVAEMREQLGGGWAVNGIAPTLTALAAGQVRTLLVHGESTVPGVRLAGSGRLLLSAKADSWRGEGPVEPVADIIDEALEEALRQRIDLDVVNDPEAARGVDGLAAILRFK
jgi:peptide subunit release factor 1 (eRF1)